MISLIHLHNSTPGTRLTTKPCLLAVKPAGNKDQLEGALVLVLAQGVYDRQQYKCSISLVPHIQYKY